MCIDLSKIVINYELALKLHGAGIERPSLFAYFQDADGHYCVFPQNQLCTGLAAYTTGELADMLSGNLEIDCQTYIVQSESWAIITAEEYNSYPYAYLQTIKQALYLCGYYYLGRSIAFSKRADGVYKNLFTRGDTEQEARAELLLAIVAEGKFPV